MKDKDYAIIHMKEFGRKINECDSINDLKDAVKEVLDELWK